MLGTNRSENTGSRKITGRHRLAVTAAVAGLCVVVAGCSSSKSSSSSTPAASSAATSSAASPAASPATSTAVTPATSGSAPASPATSGGAGSAGPLSLTNVSILSPAVQDSGLYWIAQNDGFFKKQGLNVKLVTANVGSGSQALADFLSGQYNFINEGIATGLIAAQSGAKLLAVANTDISEPLYLAINNDAVTKHNIPTAGSTAALALAQFKALKGSHITVAVTTTGSSTYYSLLAACKTNGLSCVVNSTSADIDVVTAGTTQTLVAGLLAGKFDAICNVVPQSIQPNTTTINLGEIAPISQATDYNLVTTPAFAHAHADTVQAVVTAYVEAWNYAKNNPAAAEKYVAAMEATNGIKDATEDQTLYNDFATYWRTPLLLQDAYNSAVNIVALAGHPVTVAFDAYNDPSFAQKAVAQLGLTVPTTVS